MEGVERDIHSKTPRLALLSPSAAEADKVVIRTTTELTQAAQSLTSANVNEPSVATDAVNGVVLYTGNWYAAVSVDGGNTFEFIDPKSTQHDDDPPGVTFCCDQVVHYIPSIQTFVWLLQYGPESGDNIQRLAFATSAEIRHKQPWRFFDLTTSALGVSGAFMDFPDLALGENSLYVTTNIFPKLPDKRVGAAVVRIPIDSIRQNNVMAEPFVSMELQSFRVAQNCGTTAYFATHQDTSTLLLFSWPEGQAQPASTPVGIARWLGGQGYISRTPDGRRWLDRADFRITGATKAGDDVWFAWSVDRGSNQRPRPFIQIARIPLSDPAKVENINVFDTDSATAYPALSSNSKNDVAISYMIGGAVFPSHVVGLLNGTRPHIVTAASGRGPLADPDTNKFEWGDYLTVRNVPGTDLFAATGYTLRGKTDGGNRDATPRYVVFGRDSAGTAVGGGAAAGGSGSGPGVSSGAGDTASTETTAVGPIKDVNKLSVVSPQVAAKIKAAAGISSTPAAATPQLALPPQGPELVTVPGKERWPVKTGTDDDRDLVGKNVIDGKDLGAGIVPTTVEELIVAPRPAGMTDVKTAPKAFQSKRATPVETTVWQLEATVTVLKLEKDGDYHLVLQGASGETMIGEVPTATPLFVGDSPWIANMKEARQAIEDKFVSKLSPADFVPLGTTLVPRESLSPELQATSATITLPKSFVPAEGKLPIGLPAFKTQVKPTRARITGVGFFDAVHGQTGVSQFNGIELHPILKVEWL